MIRLDEVVRSNITYPTVPLLLPYTNTVTKNSHSRPFSKGFEIGSVT